MRLHRHVGLVVMLAGEALAAAVVAVVVGPWWGVAHLGVPSALK
jgi:predicted membrane protein